MDELQVRKIIREELSNLFGIDRFTFQKNIQIFDRRDIQFGRTNGTKIGTEGYVDANNPGQKLAFWGVTPITQPSAITDALAQSVDYVQGDVQSIADAVNNILDALQAIGIIQT